jgi:hypothetical protein
VVRILPWHFCITVTAATKSSLTSMAPIASASAFITACIRSFMSKGNLLIEKKLAQFNRIVNETLSAQRELTVRLL